MTLRRGDVVIAMLPFASGAGSKPRPAVVVQSDAYNAKLRNVLVAAVTSNLAHASDPASVLIDVKTPDGKASGLLATSVVSCLNVATIDMALVARSIGHLPRP